MKTYAQDPYYISINKSNGLPSNDVYRIIQDSKGFIWIAHDEGLTRYDGHEYKTYTNPSQSSKAGSIIKEDKYGRIWYQNFDGYVYYVENDSLKIVPNQQPLGYIEYGLIDDILILINNKGFDIIDIKTMKLKKTIPFQIDIVGGAFQSKEKYYINSNRVFSIDKNGDLRNEIDKTRTGGLVVLNNRLFLVDKENGTGICYEYKNGNWENKFNVRGLQFIQHCSYAGGYYWFCTPRGVAAYDEAGNNISNRRVFFPDKNISFVFEDNEHNLWVGTLNTGILFVPNLNTRFITKDDIRPNKLGVLKHALYVATKNNVIYSYDIVSGALNMKYRDSISHVVNCLKIDTIHNAILVASKGLKIFDDKFRILYENNAAIKEVIPVDQKYFAFAATGAIGFINSNPSLQSDWDTIISKYPDSYGHKELSVFLTGRGRTVAYNPYTRSVYAGGSAGLYCITPKEIKEITIKGRSLFVTSLTAADKNMFALTSQNTILRINSDNTIQTIPFNDPGTLAYKIKEIKGDLYAITNNGLQKYSVSESKFINVYNLKGVSNEEINDIDAFDDRFFVATDKGLLLISGDNPLSVAPRLRINEIVVNGSSYTGESEHCFAHNENDIDIRYSIFSYKTGGKYPLYYSINGSVWQAVNSEAHSLKLAALSPGDYRVDFRLGEATEKLPVQSISFCIKKAFWTEWWFIFSCALLLIVGASWYYRRRVSIIKKENALITEKVELEKNLRVSMLTAIRSQMNPHFFYNALNTIQSFIFTDDKRNASTYLVKFSKLTRMILEMSEKELVSLDEEIEALTLYLELEKMRFNNDFNFEIHVTGQPDMEMPKIPPMIVQPYVENAVKHGLLHKRGEKILVVEFVNLGNTLRIMVDDNGIGRKRSEELKHIRNDKHRSFSTQANSKRIELLNKDRNQSIAVAFIDKKDNTGEPTGTTVIISIPIM